MLKLPFSILPANTLRKASHIFLGVGEFLNHFFPFLGTNLKKAEIEVEPREYLSMCFLSTFIFFLFIFLFVTLILAMLKITNFFAAAVIALIFSFFVFLQQLMYPKLIIDRRVKNLDKNLLGAAQNMMVQLSSGVPLFDILVNISKSDYGEISKEFLKAVKEINAGRYQTEVLEELAATNPSVNFRRTVWQIVNGMKSGANMGSVIKEVIASLSEEQVIQIQRYGSQLNPLAMFYMLIAVIMPALGMTFLIMLSSFIALPAFATNLIFWGFYGIVFFFQIMFLGMIKSRRPNLLGEG